jgi:putative flippase GtrA
MNNFVVQKDVDEFSPVLADLDGQPSLHSTSRGVSDSSSATLTPANSLPSYQPYSWGLLNQILDIVDQKTNGRAGWIQRFVSYLFFGGLAALVNLAVFYVMFYHAFARMNSMMLRDTLSYIVAAELSILANFIPNDHFTFNKLPGASRPWIQRCLRFHLTAGVGTGLTFLIQFVLSTLVHTEPVFAEAIATLIVLIYNFSFHHIFTYRHVKHA